MARRGTPIPWELRKRLDEFASGDEMSLRKMARELGISHNTAKKYLPKFDQNAGQKTRIM